MKTHQPAAEFAPHQKRRTAAELKARAQGLGFDLAGIAPAVTPAGWHDFLHWLERGFAGDMTYLARREAAYSHPRHVLDGVRSIVMLGMNYNAVPRRAANRLPREPIPTGDCGAQAEALCTSPPLPTTESSVQSTRYPARVARYAQGAIDYHRLIRERLDRLADFLREQHPDCKARGVVDTAPLLERDFARLAGLGWFGKNTMLINRRLGSWFFLAALLTDVELEYDPPHETAHCGTCTRCLDACPTQAFVAPWVLDSRRCISYLTIEQRGSVPEELRAGIGEWLFGCDVCQEVCPWNRKAPVTREPAFEARPDLSPADALWMLSLTPVQFAARFGKTALARPGRSGMLRNAAIVLANHGDPSAIPALERAAADADPVVREAAVWGLKRLRGSNPARH